MVVVVVSTTQSLAGAGTRFTGGSQQVGRVEPKLSHKPRKHFGWLCKDDGHQLLHNCKCFWQVPRSRNLMNFKPRDLPLHLAYGKNGEDSSFWKQKIDEFQTKGLTIAFGPWKKRPKIAPFGWKFTEITTNFSEVYMKYLKSKICQHSKKFQKNVGEHTDEIFDDLFKKYGKVVFKSNDKKSPSAEIDDDTESLSFAVAMAKVASDVKAADIKVLFVKPLVYWTRFFIIATAFSRPQIDAIGSRMRDLAEEKYGKVPSGDSKPNSWTLLDFGDVVVHIFLPQQREFYNLEEFYGNATAIELPFENQPPFRS